VGELKISSLPGLITFLFKAVSAFRHDFSNIGVYEPRGENGIAGEDIFQKDAAFFLVPLSKQVTRRRNNDII
jgi:hypothetical protein